jgi:hypothetical protein
MNGGTGGTPYQILSVLVKCEDVCIFKEIVKLIHEFNHLIE